MRKKTKQLTPIELAIYLQGAEFGFESGYKAAQEAIKQAKIKFPTSKIIDTIMEKQLRNTKEE